MNLRAQVASMALFCSLHLLLWAGTCGAAPQRPSPSHPCPQLSEHLTAFREATHEPPESPQHQSPSILQQGAFKPSSQHQINKDMYASSPKSRPPPIPPRGVQKPWPHKDQHEPWHHQSPADVSPAQQQGKSPKASPKETGFYEHGGRLFDTNHRAVPNFREALDDSKDPNSRWYEKDLQTGQWHAWKLNKQGQEIRRKIPLCLSANPREKQKLTQEQKAVIRLLETAPRVSSSRQTLAREAGFYEHQGKLFDANGRALPNSRKTLDSYNPHMRWYKKNAQTGKWHAWKLNKDGQEIGRRNPVMLSAKPKDERELPYKSVIRFRNDLYLKEVDRNGKVRVKIDDKEELKVLDQDGRVVRFVADAKTGGLIEHLGKVIDLNAQLMVENDFYGRVG